MIDIGRTLSTSDKTCAVFPFLSDTSSCGQIWICRTYLAGTGAYLYVACVTSTYNRGGQPFQSEGQMRLSGAARGSEWQTETTKWECIIQRSRKSVRRLVLLPIKKYVNVRLDGWARQQKNVIEIAVREQRAKARLPTSLWRRAVRNSRPRQIWLRCVEQCF